MPELIRGQQKAHLVRLKTLEVGGGGGGGGGGGDCLDGKFYIDKYNCRSIKVEISRIITTGNTELVELTAPPHHCFELSNCD